MISRPLGSSGVLVSRIALGGHEYLPDGRSRGFNEDMRLAVTPGWIGKGYGGARRHSVLEAAFASGINFFDVTIDSEKEALGRSLRLRPPPYPIHVQTRPEGMCYSYDSLNRKMTDYALLKAEVRRSLRLLQREHIDFLNIGILQPSLDHDREFGQKMKRNLDALKAEGLIRFAVADAFSGESTYLEMIRSGAFDAINVDLNFGDRGALERVLPEARRHGLAIIVREAFFKGALFRIAEAADLRDRRTVARLALKWVLREEVDTVIVGVDTSVQLQEHIATLESPAMNDADLALLERIESTAAFRDYATRKRAEFFPSRQR